MSRDDCRDDCSVKVNLKWENETSQQEELELHFRIHEREMLSQYPCQICDKCFTTEQDLISILLKTFSCKTLGKEFTAKRILPRHNRIHKDEKSSSVEINQKALRQQVPSPECDKEFETRDLSTHINCAHKNRVQYY